MEKTPRGRDRRRVIRTWMNRPGRIRIDGGRPRYMQVVDISARGAAVFCARPIDPGTEVEIQFRLNLPSEPVELIMHGRVDRSHERGDSHLVRILFIEPTLRALETITEFIVLKTHKTA
jgi:hypothetical protein